MSNILSYNQARRLGVENRIGGGLGAKPEHRKLSLKQLVHREGVLATKAGNIKIGEKKRKQIQKHLDSIEKRIVNRRDRIAARNYKPDAPPPAERYDPPPPPGPLVDAQGQQYGYGSGGGNGGGGMNYEDADKTDPLAYGEDGTGLTDPKAAKAGASTGGSGAALALGGAGLLLLGMKKKAKGGRLTRTNPPTATLLAIGAAGVAALMLLKKKPSAYQAGNLAVKAARDAEERKAVGDAAATRALLISAFREGGTAEVLRPRNDPRLAAAQNLGFKIAMTMNGSQFVGLSDSEVLGYIAQGGLAGLSGLSGDFSFANATILGLPLHLVVGVAGIGACYLLSKRR